MPARLGSVILIFGVVLGMLSPVFVYLKDIMDETLSSEYSMIIIKAVGISYLVQISSELCRECGESSIGTGIETVGKIELIVLSLPLIDKIILVSEELLQ